MSLNFPAILVTGQSVDEVIARAREAAFRAAQVFSVYLMSSTSTASTE